MRGFDRPLKPEWVYKIIKIAKINEKLIDQKADMEMCIPELQGDGNRKVRTIINRYFLMIIVFISSLTSTNSNAQGSATLNLIEDQNQLN